MSDKQRFRVLTVMVKRNEHQSTQVDIPPHELPILAYVHGAESLDVKGEVFLEDRELGSIQEEHARLTNKYGRDKAAETGDSRLEAVYGKAGMGMRSLAKAMEHGQDPGVPWEDFLIDVTGGEPAHAQVEETEHRRDLGAAKKRGGQQQAAS